MFQSTHPHGVRPRPSRVAGQLMLFQSTHPHGVRLCQLSTTIYRSRFNPRTRMGCDKILARLTTPYNVSIHAPAWGATAFLVKAFAPAFVSIHAPAWGATHAQNKTFPPLLFQSTHPHGVRLTMIGSIIGGAMFQSTHPHGVRQSASDVRLQKIDVSIHAPAWGATPLSRSQRFL